MHRQMMSESVDRDRSIAGSERCTWRLCTILLTLVGSALLLIGVSVVFLLPSLLPDDSRFIGASPVRLETAAPYLYAWPARLSCYCGNRCAYDCAGSDGVSAVGVGAAIGAATGELSSIGFMAVVNFAINSDFKWALLGIAALWALGMVRFWFEARGQQ